MENQKKRVLITGATDGIGLETAKKMLSLGHEVIVHGRNPEKLEAVKKELGVDTFQADFSNLNEVRHFAESFMKKYSRLDVLINNAGVYKTPSPLLENGWDVRFVVNTLAPYLLTQALKPILPVSARVISLSSAAQASVDFDALKGSKRLDDFEAYAQSKLALTMWSRHLAHEWQSTGPILISVNPGSLLATKMVREGFGTAGSDINIGVNILISLSLDEEHASSSGMYFDNDAGSYSAPQADGLDDQKTMELISVMEETIAINRT